MRSTDSRVSAETSGRPFKTRDTVAIETPAALAMSRIVARGRSAPLPLSVRASIAPFRKRLRGMSPQSMDLKWRRQRDLDTKWKSKLDNLETSRLVSRKRLRQG